jgi:hypothetical protein
VEHFQWNAPGNLAPKGAGILKLKVFWRQKARVVLRLKISGMILVVDTKQFQLPTDLFKITQLLIYTEVQHQ